MDVKPRQIRDKSTFRVLVLAGLPAILLLAELIFPPVRNVVLAFHNRQELTFRTFITDMVGIMLVGIAFTLARLDFRTIETPGVIANEGSDFLKSLMALVSFVIGLMAFLAGRYAGIGIIHMGILHVIAIPALVSGIIIALYNRRSTPVRIRDNSTFWVLGLGGPSMTALLSELAFSHFKSVVQAFHTAQSATFPTYGSDMFSIMLITFALTLARLDYRTINVTGADKGNDANKSLLALCAGVFGVILAIGGRLAGWHIFDIGLIHALAIPMAISALVIALYNRK